MATAATNADGPPGSSVGAGDRCRVCGAADLEPSRLFRSRSWTVLTCGRCQGSYVEPMPGPAAVAPEYRYDDYGRRWYERSARSAESRIRALQRLLAEARSEGLPTGRLLDVGCSAGQLLVAARRGGWEPEGLEIDPETAARARERAGVPVQVGTGLEAVRAGRPFNAIVMSHWLEHTPDPAGQLSLAAGLLAPGGGLLLRVPNAAGRVARRLGADWRWFTPPVHLYYFGPRTIQVLSDRAGLRLVSQSTRQGDAYPYLVERVAGRLRRRARQRSESRAGAGPERELPPALPWESTLRPLLDLASRANPFRRWEDTELVALLTRPAN